MNKHIATLLQEIANGESLAEVISVLEEDTVKGYERVKFLLGTSSQPVRVSLGLNPIGSFSCSIQVMIGDCRTEVEQVCRRLRDFMDVGTWGFYFNRFASKSVTSMGIPNLLYSSFCLLLLEII